MTQFVNVQCVYHAFTELCRLVYLLSVPFLSHYVSWGGLSMCVSILDAMSILNNVALYCSICFNIFNMSCFALIRDCSFIIVLVFGILVKI